MPLQSPVSETSAFPNCTRISSSRTRLATVSFGVIGCVLILVSACSRIRQVLSPAPVMTPGARQALSALQQMNSGLKTFKGIGSLRLWRKDGVRLNQRVAWVGFFPERLRLAVWVSGYPAVSMATDGQWLYYLEVQSGRSFYRKVAASEQNLKRIIQVAVAPADVTAYLAGRVPLRKFDSAELDIEPNGERVLSLRRRWRGVVEKIYLKKTAWRPIRVEMFERSGSPAYACDLGPAENIGGFQIPRRVDISSEGQGRMQLEVDRYWPNVAVDPSVFVIAPPK